MYEISVNDKLYKLSNIKEKQYEINGKTYEMDIIPLANHQYHLIVNNKSYNIKVQKGDVPKTYDIFINGNIYQTIASDHYDILLKDLGMDRLAVAALSEIKAPMPGMVIDLMVKEKDSVKAGEPLLILEAMKMENVIKASTDVVIKKVLAVKGKAVEKNEVMIEFE